jgi:hypothetical protein
MTVKLDCPVKSCARGRKIEHLMCWPHWNRVPRILQRAVWDTFGRLRRSGPTEFQEARAQYDKAAADAIAAVEAKEAA